MADKPEVWVYTSLYKDTIADLEPKLAVAFPDVKFNFFQAGSEEVAAKVNAEEMAGGTKADIMIFSDRFFYEEMVAKGKLHPYQSKAAETVPTSMKNSGGHYATVSVPVMVLIYNNESIPDKEAPKTFKEMAEPRWKGKFSTGSPLSSGTNFTTVAFLTEAYGWDFIKDLRKNDTISEGGNSAVIRRVQSKERPVGWVLLENALRVVDSDKRIKIVFPADGAILQANSIGIIKKTTSRVPAEKFVDWMYGKDGQAAMIKSFMYSPLPGFDAPKGAPPFSEILQKSKPWTPEFIAKTLKDRESIKEQFAKIMFH